MIRDELTGNPRTLTKLPEGIEGVFEPSVGGTRLQRGKSVRGMEPCREYTALI